MRNALLLILASVLGSACYSSQPQPYPGGYERAPPFEADTTDGNNVLVAEDPRSGYFFIVEPIELRGQQVAIVNRQGERMLVTRDVRVRHRYQGSAGDIGRR